MGKFEVANHGTIFLDEVSELPKSMQVKLLRFLQEGTIERLGGNRTIRLDVRIFASTNQDLEQRIADGEFREDLYHRLKVVPIHVPPLRDRPGDESLLAEYYRHHFCLTMGRPTRRLNEAARRALAAYSWPGNVRELQNVLQRYCTLGTLDFLSNSGIVSDPDESTPLKDKEVGSGKNSNATVAVMEKKMIIDALEQNQWNRQRAAKQLDINIRSFYRKLKKYDIIQTR